MRIADERWRSACLRSAAIAVTSPKMPLDGPTAGSMAAGIAEQLQQFGIPAGRAQVEQLRARRVRRIAGVDGAAGQVPEHPAVDRPGARARRVGARRCAVRERVEQPAQLARREQRVDRQARVSLELRLAGRARAVPRRTPPSAGTARRCTGRAGCPVARSHSEHRLALVGDARRRRSRDAGDARQTLVDRVPRTLSPERGRASCSHPAGCGNAISAPACERSRDDHGRRRRRTAAPWCSWCPGRWRGCACAPWSARQCAFSTSAARRRGCRRRVRPKCSSRNVGDPVGAKTPGTPRSRMRTGWVETTTSATALPSPP